MKRFVFLLLILSSLFLSSCKKCYQCEHYGQVCSGSPMYNQVQTASSQAGVYVLVVNNTMYTCSY